MGAKSEAAVRAFREGRNCAQAVLVSFAAELGLAPELALKIASGLGGGMGRLGEICGALSGGILTLGLRFGGPDRASIETTYGRVRELLARFRQRHGEILCRRLLEGIDLATEEGHRRFQELGLREQTCRRCVQSAAELVEELMTG